MPRWIIWSKRVLLNTPIKRMNTAYRLLAAKTADPIGAAVFCLIYKTLVTRRNSASAQSSSEHNYVSIGILDIEIFEMHTVAMSGF
jgi:hypothetical protein